MQDKIAAIDLGTNSARLLIGSIDSTGLIQPVLLQRHITRLGGGFMKQSGISAEARERTIKALMDFSGSLKKLDVTHYRAVATSAVRDAANGKEFAGEVFDRTGIHLEIIDGEEEALLTLRGVLSGLDDRSGHFFLFDIGGGSTEYTLTRGDIPLFTKSLPLGVVRLTEGKVTREAMDEKIVRELSKLAADIDSAGYGKGVINATLVGTAGTATTLASIHLKMDDYDYRKVNNYCLSLDSIRDILRKLFPMSLEERLRVPGLEKGREDLIIAGALLTVRTMENFGFDRLKVSDYGLLEGVLFSIRPDSP